MQAGCTNTEDVSELPSFSRTESLSGQMFAGFEIREQLGAGGMGVVYRGVDRRLGRSVALKFLASVDAMHGETRERFLREARSASALDHPNIATVYSVEEGANGALCIVMAYYDGETVADRLSRGRIPLKEALRIAIEVADGLAEAHANNVIHRDIKPSNILLTRTGGVKVVDFGLATCPTGDQSLTQPRAVMGTAAYMSPEQARGVPVDPRSDIWSLGAVLFEMVTGQRPFPGGSTFSVLRSVVNLPPQPMDAGFPELERTVLKAMEKAPSNRYASMRQFGEALRKLKSSLELEDSRPTIGVGVSRSLTVRWPARVRARWFVLAGLVGALGLAAVPAVRHRIAQMIPSGLVARQPIPVAILPFTAEDESTGALARGLAQSVSLRIAGLERFEGSLAVIPTTELAARQITDAQSAQKSAGATVAIAGTLTRRPGGTLHLQLEFRDTRSSEPVQSSLEDRSGDVGALEERAAGQIAAMLDLRSASQVRAARPADQRAYEAYLRGLGYLQRWDKNGNLDSAISAFTEAVGISGDFALAYASLAEASRTRFRTDKDPASIQHALNYAQQAVRLDANLAEAHVVLGRVLQDTSQRDLAMAEFRKALELDERNSTALLGMGRAHEDSGKIPEAESTFRRAVALSPYSWAARNNLASFYIRQRRFHDAEAQFRRALVLAPDSAALTSNLGVVLMHQSRTREALAAFERSIALGPSYAAWVNIGNIHYRARQFRSAAGAYDEALKLNRRDYRIWGTKAQSLRLAGAPAPEYGSAYQQAIALAEQELKIVPGQARTASQLSVYYACVGDRAAAHRFVQQALNQGGRDRDVLIDAAATYQVLGDSQSAALWANTALAQGYPWDELRSDPDLEPLVRSGAVRSAKG